MAVTAPIGYWKLDESSGNAADATGNGYTMTNSNVTYSAGKINNGADFNSTSDRLSNTNAVFDFQRNVAFSVQFWVNLTALGSNQFLVSNQEGTSTFIGWCLYHSSSGKINFDMYQNLSGPIALAVATPTSAISAGSYAHVVFTKSTATTVSGVKIYVNGTSQSLTTGLDTLTSNITYAADLNFGTRTGASSNMNGQLDEIGIWDVELTGSEVTELYNGGAGLAYPFGSLAVASSFMMRGMGS
jgi:hypothetical protein